MQIELIGCTGAGKSTLTRGIFQACRAQKIDALYGEDFVLKQVRLNWVNCYIVRTVVVDICSLFACLLTWRTSYVLYLLTLQNVFRLPASATWFERLNIVRNTLKKIGMYEIIRHHGPDQQVILIDEGTLHTAQYLFVRSSVEAMISDMPTFAKLLPLPDVTIYLRQNEGILVERTLRRGHKRIPGGSRVQTERFIKRAVVIFENLVQYPSIKSKLFLVDGGESITPAPDCQNDPALMITMQILRTGLDVVNSEVSS